MLEISDQRLVADRIDDLPDPAESVGLIGHEAQLQHLKDQFASGRMHHAWLITGPKGIGKATLAYHFASHVLTHTGANQTDALGAGPTDHEKIDSRVRSGGHGNLLAITRPWDDKAKKFKTQVTVDEVRRISSFFGMTAAEQSWRICLVDSVDEMNQNAANALLKSLEEPPTRTLFLLVSHSPGRLLPTIRSRCQQIALKPLSDVQLVEAVKQVMGADTPNQNELEEGARLANGSVRKAITLLLQDGLALHQDIERICQSIKEPDWGMIHTLAGKLAPRAQDERFGLFLELVFDHLCERATNPELIAKNRTGELARWTEVWEKTATSVRQADSYNLDRKQVILSLFQSMQEAA